MLLGEDPVRAFMPYEPVAVPNASDGPLAGLTLAVKDIFDVAGYRTGCGCPLKLAASPIAKLTAHAPQMMLDAGARFVGKTHTDELAWSMYGMNAHFGTPINAAAPDRIPGGSSSGSAAAVAAGLADIALGTDTGGSVRAPASFCGLWGLRPTHGRIALDGCMELAASYDTCGLFARDPAAFEAAAKVLLGPDPRPLPDRPEYLAPTDMLSLLGTEARSACEDAFAGLSTCPVEVYPDGVQAAYAAFLTTVGADAARGVLPFIKATAMPLVRGIAERAAAAAALSPEEISDANAVRDAFRGHINAVLGTSGVLLVPAAHDAPFRLDAGIEVFDGFRHEAQRLLCVAGLAGLPQVVMPAGMVDGAPFGVSLIGPAGSDLSLIGLARQMKAAA